MRYLPNILTLTRLILIPVFVFLMIEPDESQRFIAFWIFVVAALTDYADGLIARLYDSVSDFGKLADPLADKLLVMSALVMLVAQRSDAFGEPWVPAWMVVIILGREMWINGIRAVAANKGIIMAAGTLGKIKSWLQMIAIGFLIFHDPLEIRGQWLHTQWVGLNLLFLSIGFSLWSAFDYTVAVFWEQGEEGKPSEAVVKAEG